MYPQVRDYSGAYEIHLLTCTITEDVVYSLPLTCHPRDLVSFDLQVRLVSIAWKTRLYISVSENYSCNCFFYNYCF